VLTFIAVRSLIVSEWELGELRRHRLRLNRFLPDRRDQVRIDVGERVGFQPCRLVEVAIGVVDREEHREEVVGRLAEHPLQQLPCELPDLGPGARIRVALRRGVEEQRIAARAGRGRQHVQQVRRLMRVDLVERDVGRVQSVLRRGLRVDRLKARPDLQSGDRLGEYLQTERLPQFRGLLDHPLRGILRVLSRGREQCRREPATAVCRLRKPKRFTMKKTCAGCRTIVGLSHLPSTCGSTR
jgi:hypothetical protein